MAKSSSLSKRISDRIRERGPITVAAFMDVALYDPDAGYYARAARRTGRAGDFFTSVDVGPLFGDLIAKFLKDSFTPFGSAWDLVDAGAADGRLAADVADALERRDPALYATVRLHLVERSRAARRAHHGVLGRHARLLASSSDELPSSIDGVVIANELLDALPVHQVVMREGGLREIYVAGAADGTLTTIEGPLSSDAVADYLADAGAELEIGWRAEVNLAAASWVRDTARRLRRGLLILFDYGHPAAELYSAGHSSGTLTTFASHRANGPGAAGAPSWLAEPGEHDITAHVDFTTVQAAAEAEGLETVGFMDQTYFLMGIAAGAPEELARLSTEQRQMFKTLVAPGGLGSTMKVVIESRGVALAPLPWPQRVT